VRAADFDLITELAADVFAGTIDVFYQPIMTGDDGLLGHEALARWQRDGRTIEAGRFIGAAAKAGLLNAIDDLVFDRALSDLAALGGDDTGFVAVNCGLGRLADDQFAERFARRLRSSAVSAERIVLELSETHAIEDHPVARASLDALRATGVRLALDDFGVGYSSLMRAQTLCPDIIKIDRAFVAPLSATASTASVLAGVIDLAHRLGAIVIAEGVETVEQRATLLRLGCDGVQGYLLGEPAPAPVRRSAVPVSGT
jgi:EAL domain-containing protein (putative c-di-GMP-specific phosphodiesterase class I)